MFIASLTRRFFSAKSLFRGDLSEFNSNLVESRLSPAREFNIFSSLALSRRRLPTERLRAYTFYRSTHASLLFLKTSKFVLF